MGASAIGWIVTTGEPQTGLWCPNCSLPSVVEISLTILTEDGAGGSLGHMFACTECEEAVPSI